MADKRADQFRRLSPIRDKIPESPTNERPPELPSTHRLTEDHPQSLLEKLTRAAAAAAPFAAGYVGAQVQQVLVQSQQQSQSIKDQTFQLCIQVRESFKVEANLDLITLDINPRLLIVLFLSAHAPKLLKKVMKGRSVRELLQDPNPILDQLDSTSEESSTELGAEITASQASLEAAALLRQTGLTEQQTTAIYQKVRRFASHPTALPTTVDVFISHATVDQPVPQLLHNLLKDRPLGNRKCQPFFAEDSIAWASPWREFIEHAISICPVVMLFNSAAAVKSRWVQWEIDRANKRGGDCYILAVQLDDTPLLSPLGDTQFRKITNPETELPPIADRILSLLTQMR